MHARGFQQIEKLSSCYRVEANLDGSRICRESIDQTESFSMDQEFVKKLSSLKKTVFQREEKHTEKNAIKQATQPKIQSTFKLLKTSLNKKNAKHLGSKHTHTHTHIKQV